MSSDDPGQRPEAVTLAVSARGIYPRLFLHDRAETISNFIRSFGVWQRPITSFMASYLGDGDVFVDVGANIGYFSVFAGLCVGSSGKVHAVEPDPDNAALLARNLALNGLSSAKLHRTAASEFSGEATLFRGEFNAGSHSLIKKDGLSAGLKVPVTTLDLLLSDEPKVKVIKIDVQGAEMNVLRGVKQLLARSGAKPGIIVEFSAVDLARSGQLDEFFKFISANGYSLRAFISNERSQIKPPQIRRSTLRQIAEDFLEADEAAELDILLLSHR